MIYITLNMIHKNRPCLGGWKKLCKYLGKTKPDDEPFPITEILKSNGLQDTLWCLRCIDAKIEKILFAANCAERVLYLFEKEYPDDNRPRKSIEAARKFAMENAIMGDLDAAMAASGDAAWAAARAAARAAGAAGDAAWAAARAAGDAAWAAAGDDMAAARAAGAAGDAARAAGAAAGDDMAAAWDATRDAAWVITWAAAWDAAGAAVWVTTEDAARDFEEKEQEKLFIKYFGE